MKSSKSLQTTFTIALSFASALMLSACGIPDRVSNIGKPPAMSGIQTAQNTANSPEIIKLPMPSVQEANKNANSLWQPSRQTFFKDQRAHKVGDILTINIDIKDEADLQNKTERQRRGNEQTGLPNLAGFEGYLGKVLPGGVDPNNLVGMSSNSTSVGDGKIKRLRHCLPRRAVARAKRAHRQDCRTFRARAAPCRRGRRRPRSRPRRWRHRR